MPPEPQTTVRLRPIDLARAQGLSTQAVRNYEAGGILPVAIRSPHGHRTYTPRHAQALHAFLALVRGHGHPTATAIMQAVNRGAVEEALRLIDESHAQLLDDRRTFRAVEAALKDLDPGAAASGGGAANPSGTPVRPARSSKAAAASPAFVGPLSHRLGVRPATLRKWERAGLIHPHRDPRTGYRVYSEADVRDAQLTHQLRRGGYLLSQIAPLLSQVRAAGGVAPLESTLQAWNIRLTARSRAMLAGAAALNTYLDAGSPPPAGREHPGHDPSSDLPSD